MQITPPIEQRFRVLILNRDRIFVAEDKAYRAFAPTQERSLTHAAYALPEGVFREGDDLFPTVEKFCKETLQLQVKDLRPLEVIARDRVTGLWVHYFLASTVEEVSPSFSSLKVDDKDYVWCSVSIMEGLLFKSKEVADNRTLMWVLGKVLTEVVLATWITVPLNDTH